MFSRFRSAALMALSVCADPNNMPFSNQREQGFENKLADLVARELKTTVRYTWWAQRRNFVKQTLGAGRCDAIMGLPAGFESVLTTAPYYTSTYVFVYRTGGKAEVRSFDDPALRGLKIGVHVIDDNYAPPAHALARRGIRNLTGYSLYGSGAEVNPPAKIIDAVAKGDIDVAMVWGPLGGYFAKRESVPMQVVPVSPARDGVISFTYPISVAVRKGNVQLAREIGGVLAAKHAEVQRILSEYGVPEAAVR